MPVVAVINRKGGSGKSTLATQLAGYCASTGLRVMLGDVDRQQSSLGWLRRRAAQPAASAAPIGGWAIEAASMMRPPAGITHVVLDTPAGLRGFELARVVATADAILVPVGGSMFDRDAATECIAELRAQPRVASGRCTLAVVGMRLDPRGDAIAELRRWAARMGLPCLAGLRESQAYVRGAEQGLTVFDPPLSKAGSELRQWQPVIDWLLAAWRAAEAQAAKSGRQPAGASARRPAGVAASSPSSVPALRVPAPRPEPHRESRYEPSDVLDSRLLGGMRRGRAPKRATLASRFGRWLTAIRPAQAA
jgi:chromosome partitioning protein